MIFKRLAATLGAALLALTGCVSDAGRVEKAPPGAVPGPALWVLSDADTTIYLFGTVHALPKDKNWFDARLARAFDASQELVTEIDAGSLTASGPELAAAGMLEGEQSLRDHMTPEARQRYEEALVSQGLPVATLDRMEPWLAAMTLSYLPLARAGYESQSGVELSLESKAGERKREGLETIGQQIALFDEMPREAQLAFLDEVVTSLPNSRGTLDAMIAEWLEGDAAGLAKLLNAEMDDPVLYQRLLIDRNARWAEWIGQRMKQPGTVFVAVGAGHLAGAGSVQDHLRKRGFRVRRIWQ